MLRLFSLAALGAAFMVSGHYPPWMSFQNECLAALALGLLIAHVATSAQLGKNRVRELIRFRIVHVVFLLSAVPLIQWVSGRAPGNDAGFLSAAYLLMLACAVVVGRHMAAEKLEGWIDTLAMFFGAVASLSVAIAWVQWLKPFGASLWIADLPPGGRPFGNLGQVNHQAVLLMLGLIGLQRLFERQRLGAVASGVVALWLTTGLSMAQSRTTLLILAIWGAWLLATRRRFARRLPAMACAAVAAFYALGVLAWAPVNEFLLLTPTEPLGSRLVEGPRLQIWSAMLGATTLAPWLGHGFNRTSVAQVAWAVDHPAGYRYLDSAHNLILDLALWQGWPLTLLLAGASVAWIVRRWRRLAAAPKGAAPEADALWPWLLALASYAMVEYPYRYLFFLIPAGLIVGAIEAVDERLDDVLRTPPRRRIALPSWSAPAASLAILAGTVGVAAAYLPVEESYRRMRLAMLGVGSKQAVLDEAPRSRLLDGPLAFQKFALTEARAGISDAEWREARRAAERWPMPPALLRLALLAGLNDRPNEAAGYLRAICHMNTTPRCVEARESWTALRAQHPVLQSIPLPEIPPRP